MSDRLGRRQFLIVSCRAAFGFPFLSLAATAQDNPPSGEATQGAAWRPLVADLEKQIPQVMEETVVPGLSIAIFKDDRIIWRRGFGIKDVTTKERVNEETIFEAASMSKPVFAYAVMKLCEKGVLDLDTPLTQYTPERFLKGDPRLKLITARHVLSHTTGFQDWRSKAEPLKIHFTPGEKWQYSGEGYSYLQSVVTHLTGHVNPKECGRFEAGLKVCATDMDQYLKTNILKPFGMTSSGYVWDKAFEKHMARPHGHQGEPLELHKSTAVSVARYGAAGALLSTPTDYSKFLIEVVDPKPADAFRLSKDSLQEMLRPQVKMNEEYSISWGLGWRIAQTTSGNLIGHGGDNVGFHSLAEASVERKTGYVIMTNGDNGGILLKKLAPDISRRFCSLPAGSR